MSAIDDEVFEVEAIQLAHKMAKVRDPSLVEQSIHMRRAIFAAIIHGEAMMRNGEFVEQSEYRETIH